MQFVFDCGEVELRIDNWKIVPKSWESVKVKVFGGIV